MNILILGTSNSILREGYVKGLATALPGASIHNRSIGASPGVQFGLVLNTDFSAYDYVVFDSLPNDEEYAYHNVGYKDDPLYDRILFEIMSSISLQTNLIIIGFCMRFYLDKRSPLYEKRRLLARAVGAAFIDIPDILDAFRFTGYDGDVYGDHPSHPKVEMSFEIGKRLGDEMQAGSAKIEKAGLKSYKDNFSVFSVPASLPRHRQTSFENSLLEETFSTLPDGTTIHFDRPARCVGLSLNISGTNCTAVFSIRGAPVLDAALYYFQQDLLLKCFVPLPGVPAIDCLEIGSETARTAIHPSMAVQIKEETPPRALISDILFWSGDEAEPWSEALIISEQQCLETSKTILRDIYVKRLRRFNEPRSLGKISTAVIKTYHNTYIAFDATKHCCVQVADLNPPVHIRPTLLAWFDQSCCFYYVNETGVLVPLFVSIVGLLPFPFDDSASKDVVAERFPDGSVAFRLGSKYLSASPDGGIPCNRDIAGFWERFSLETQALV